MASTTIDLRNRETLAINDIRGATLHVLRGTVWITQENDSRDVVLRPGDVWAVERDGLTIIEAQSDVALHAVGTRIVRAVRARAPIAQRAARLWRYVRAHLTEWYSLTPRRPIPHV